MTSELDKKFKEAYQTASTTAKKLPPDLMLKLYAYYKQATQKDNITIHKPSGNVELRNAFKLNAWFQLGKLTSEEAKAEYIELVQKYLK